MTPASKTSTASAAATLSFALLIMIALPAGADEFCITNGAQAAHGCGYPTMETCRAASAGIGGSCARSRSSGSTSDALASQPKHPRAKLRSGERIHSN
jgi:hypothetical protein